MRLYPFLFEPNLHPVVWGGHRLMTYKGIAGNQTAQCSLPTGRAGESLPIGESWEVSAVPSSISIISNGDYAGQKLTDVIDQSPVAILGEAVTKEYGGKLPLLVKFIDAERDLSIQVHPNDEMAQRVHGKMGKSEMWYIIDAKPGSYLYAGFKKQITKEEFKQLIADHRQSPLQLPQGGESQVDNKRGCSLPPGGDDGGFTSVLARHEVHKGDVFYLPAGRVHAICGGILLAEVQQSSDVTYRIFDYNRPGMDGKPRELHTELAAEALDFNVQDDYRTHYTEPSQSANPVINSPYFNVRVTEITNTFHRNLIKYDSFIITMCIKGDCIIRIRETGDEIRLNTGNSCLIPAVIADYDVIPLHHKTRILDAFIDNKDRSITSKITRFLHITQK